MKKILLVVLLLTTLSQVANALGQTPATKIKYISVYPNATIIQLSNTHANEDGCTHASATEYVYLPNDGSDGSKSLYAAVLSAQATGSTILLGYSGCTAAFPTMYRIDFLP
jgi:hypothetical protein